MTRVQRQRFHGAIAACLLTAGWGQVLAQSTDDAPQNSAATKEAKPYSFSLKPVLIDSGSATGTSLGVDYEFTGKYQFWTTKTVAGPVIDPSVLDKTFTSGQLDLRARGTLAASKEKNPNKLIDFAGSAVYKVDADKIWAKVGGALTYETDQSFEKKQYMFSMVGVASKVSTIVNGDAGSIIANYGTVNPTKDETRTKLTGNKDNFRRWDLEVSYSVPVRSTKVRSIDFDYRHYQEVSAPTVIKTAGLDRNRLGLIRANLDQGFFVQYSKGSLPFDQRSERAVKIGWSALLE